MSLWTILSRAVFVGASICNSQNNETTRSTESTIPSFNFSRKSNDKSRVEHWIFRFFFHSTILSIFLPTSMGKIADWPKFLYHQCTRPFYRKIMRIMTSPKLSLMRGWPSRTASLGATEIVDENVVSCSLARPRLFLKRHARVPSNIPAHRAAGAAAKKKCSFATVILVEVSI